MMTRIVYSFMLLLWLTAEVKGQSSLLWPNTPPQGSSTEQAQQKWLSLFGPQPQSGKNYKVRGYSRLLAVASSYVTSLSPLQYTPTDSVHYYYKGAYGYDITPSMFDNMLPNMLNLTAQDYFDSSYAWAYNTGSMSYLPNDSTGVQFNSNHRLTQESHFLFALPGRYNYTYQLNTNQSVYIETDTTELPLGTGLVIKRYLFSYYPSGYVESMEEQLWDSASSVWIPELKDSMFYTTSNLPDHSVEYEYQTATSSWKKTILRSFFYNASQERIQFLSSNWNGVAWVDDFRELYSYNGTNALSGIIHQSWIAPAWTNNYKDSFNYAGGPHPAVTLRYNWMGGNWTASYRYTHTFNSYQQILLQVLHNWNTSNSTWEESWQARFYYEGFDPEAVPEESKPLHDWSLWPNPVQHSFHVSGSWATPKPFTIQITDLLGKKYLTEQFPAQSSFETTFTPEIVPGIYILELQGDQFHDSKLFIKE